MLAVNVGQGQKEILQQMADQMGQVGYVHGTQFTTKSIEDYGDALGEMLPSGLGKTYFLSGGSESIGAVAPPDGYLPLIKEICGRYGILFINDEMMTGMGRTGRWFAVEHWEVLPDILVLGKGMSGGYFPCH